jgi:site-specific DNA-methyltransferase (adenine-specific)
MITCFNSDSEKAILEIKDESVDIICIDPPYLYLKNQTIKPWHYPFLTS